MKNDNLQMISDYVKFEGEISYDKIKNNFSFLNESTIARNLAKLIKEGKITKKRIGRNTFYSFVGEKFVKDYFDVPFFERKKVKYNFNFLADYEPNKTSFLGEKYEIIKKQYLDKNTLSTYDYKANIREIENLIIDLSFSSSKLEGNTYSYLDTEVLIKYNEEAEGKTKLETQMILNHKNAIKYIIENKNDINYTKSEFQNIHALLGKGLILDQYLGIVRNNKVNIGGSSYEPLDNKNQLEEQFEIFLEKLNQIKNPFEQVIFILVFISYLQLFIDINKRVARISANLPLIKNGLVPFSFLQIKERDYIDAILAIYELNNTDILAELFVNNYLLNLERYI